MSQARIGIIGAGFWAAYFYLPFLRDHPDAVCVGVVRPEADALAALKARLLAPPGCHDRRRRSYSRPAATV